MISTFYKTHPEKPIAMILSIDSTLLMSELLVKPLVEILKWKQGQSAKTFIKQFKKINLNLWLISVEKRFSNMVTVVWILLGSTRYFLGGRYCLFSLFYFYPYCFLNLCFFGNNLLIYSSITKHCHKNSLTDLKNCESEEI